MNKCGKINKKLVTSVEQFALINRHKIEKFFDYNNSLYPYTTLYSIGQQFTRQTQPTVLYYKMQNVCDFLGMRELYSSIEIHIRDLDMVDMFMSGFSDFQSENEVIAIKRLVKERLNNE